MFRIEVPQDVRKVKTKFLGPFTMRETIWVIIGAACAYFAVYLQKLLIPDVDPISVWILIAVAPAGIMGFVPIMGMPIEKFITTSFSEIFLSKKILPIKGENTFREFFDYWNKVAEKEETEQLRQRMKLNKEFAKQYKKNMKMQEAVRKENLKLYLKDHPMLK